MNYRAEYVRKKQVALQHYRALMKIALTEKNRDLFWKYSNKVEQLSFELTKGLVG